MTKTAEGFFACPAHGPFEASERPETYACLHAASNLSDGGGALLVFDVPLRIVQGTPDFDKNIEQGFVEFNGPSFTELRASWRSIKKRIIPFNCQEVIRAFYEPKTYYL
jgi:hypothetical protein